MFSGIPESIAAAGALLSTAAQAKSAQAPLNLLRTGRLIVVENDHVK